MYCRTCGHECPPDASFCPSCGRQVDSSQPPAPPSAADRATANTIQNYLILAIFSTALCCMPFGIPGIVFAVQARTRHQLGDAEAAAQSLAKAKLWSWLSFGFGMIIPLFYLAAIVVTLFTET